jgi:hypothetical protein
MPGAGSKSLRCRSTSITLAAPTPELLVLLLSQKDSRAIGPNLTRTAMASLANPIEAPIKYGERST